MAAHCGTRLLLLHRGGQQQHRLTLPYGHRDAIHHAQERDRTAGGHLCAGKGDQRCRPIGTREIQRPQKRAQNRADQRDTGFLTHPPETEQLPKRLGTPGEPMRRTSHQGGGHSRLTQTLEIEHRTASLPPVRQYR